MRCQDVLNRFTATRQPFTPANVIAALKADDQIGTTENILCALYAKLLRNLVSVTNSNPAAGKHFRQLLEGFQRGQLRASELVFQNALSLGYGLGYRDGFEAGYARGYADGYNDGYDAANSSFWSRLFNAISDVATIASAVETILVLCA